MAITFIIDGVPVTSQNHDNQADALAEFNQLRASNPEQAQAFIEGKRRSAETKQWLTTNASKLGLSSQDIDAITSLQRKQILDAAGNVAGEQQESAQGYVPETASAFDRARIGYARELQSLTRGARNLVIRSVKTVAPGLIGGISNEDLDKMAKDEIESRRLFSKLDDQGIGAEDGGQLLMDALGFAAGGSVANGIKWTATGGRAALAGLTSQSVTGSALLSMFEGAANDRNSDVAMDAALGGTLGFIAPMLTKGIPGVRGLMRTGPSTMSVLAAMAAAGRGNSFLMATALGRAMWQSKMGQKLINSGMIVSKEQLAAQRQASQIATNLRQSLGTTISVLRRQHQESAAVGAAMTAYERAFTTIEGQTVFNASKFNQALDLFTQKELTALGVFGTRLSDIRQVARALEKFGTDQIDSKMLPGVIANLAKNPEARRLLPALAAAKTPTVANVILTRLSGAAAGTARAGGLGAGIEAGKDAINTINPLSGESYQ